MLLELIRGKGPAAIGAIYAPLGARRGLMRRQSRPSDQLAAAEIARDLLFRAESFV